jgi:hypothetical protein
VGQVLEGGHHHFTLRLPGVSDDFSWSRASLSRSISLCEPPASAAAICRSSMSVLAHLAAEPNSQVVILAAAAGHGAFQCWRILGMKPPSSHVNQ